jgi:hypothetical protein
MIAGMSFLAQARSASVRSSESELESAHGSRFFFLDFLRRLTRLLIFSFSSSWHGSQTGITLFMIWYSMSEPGIWRRQRRHEAVAKEPVRKHGQRSAHQHRQGLSRWGARRTMALEDLLDANLMLEGCGEPQMKGQQVSRETTDPLRLPAEDELTVDVLRVVAQ